MSRNKKYQLVQKMCPICNTSFEARSGHPKEKSTCSYTCANKHFRGKKSDRERCKIAETTRRVRPRVLHTKQCPTCDKVFTTPKKQQICCSRSCRAKNMWNDKNYRDTITNNSKTKMLERVRLGIHSGWKSRKNVGPSFPERYFSRIFDTIGVDYEPEFPCGRYFIDFAFLRNKIALEVDGKQHEMEKRKFADAKKDAYLTTCGWTVYRIKWKNIRTNAGKHEMEEEVKKFLQIIRS